MDVVDQFSFPFGFCPGEVQKTMGTNIGGIPISII